MRLHRLYFDLPQGPQLSIVLLIALVVWLFNLGLKTKVMNDSKGDISTDTYEIKISIKCPDSFNFRDLPNLHVYSLKLFK